MQTLHSIRKLEYEFGQPIHIKKIVSQTLDMVGGKLYYVTTLDHIEKLSNSEKYMDWMAENEGVLCYHGHRRRRALYFFKEEAHACAFDLVVSSYEETQLKTVVC